MAEGVLLYLSRYFFVLPLVIFICYGGYWLRKFIKQRSQPQTNQVRNFGNLPAGTYPQQAQQQMATGFENSLQKEANLINTNATMFRDNNTNCKSGSIIQILLERVSKEVFNTELLQPQNYVEVDSV